MLTVPRESSVPVRSKRNRRRTAKAAAAAAAVAATARARADSLSAKAKASKPTAAPPAVIIVDAVPPPAIQPTPTPTLKPKPKPKPKSKPRPAALRPSPPIATGSTFAGADAAGAFNALDFLVQREEELMEVQRKVAGRFAALSPPLTVQCVRCHIWCDSETRFCFQCEENERTGCSMFLQSSPSTAARKAAQAKETRAKQAKVVAAVAASAVRAVAELEAAQRSKTAPAAPTLASSSDDEPQLAVSIRAAALAEAALLAARRATEFNDAKVAPPALFAPNACVRDGEMAALVAGLRTVKQHPDKTQVGAIESSALCRECNSFVTTNPAFCKTCRDDLTAATINVGFVAHVEASEEQQAEQAKALKRRQRQRQQREQYAARQQRLKLAARHEQQQRAMAEGHAQAMRSMLAPSTPPQQQQQAELRAKFPVRFDRAVIVAAAVVGAEPPAGAPAAGATIAFPTNLSAADREGEDDFAKLARAAAVALPVVGAQPPWQQQEQQQAPMPVPSPSLTQQQQQQQPVAAAAAAASELSTPAISISAVAPGGAVGEAVAAVRNAVATHRAAEIEKLGRLAPSRTRAASAESSTSGEEGGDEASEEGNDSDGDAAADADAASASASSAEEMDVEQRIGEQLNPALDAVDLTTMTPREATAFLVARKLEGVRAPSAEQRRRHDECIAEQRLCKRARVERQAERSVKRQRGGGMSVEEEVLFTAASDMAASDALALLRHLQEIVVATEA